MKAVSVLTFLAIAAVLATAGTHAAILTPLVSDFGSLSPSSAQSVTIGGSQTFSATAVAFWYLGTWSVDGNTVTGSLTLSDGTTVDLSGLTLTFGNVQGSHTVQATFVLTSPAVHTFAAGIQMFSVPTDYSSQSVASVLGYSSPVPAVWEPAADTYSVTPTPPANSLVPGQGYWVRFPASESIASLGTAPSTPFTITMATGWNMIGCPQATAVSLSALTVIDASDVPHTFAAAASSGLVQDPLYTFQAGDTNYEVVTGATGSLTPYDGYWLFASNPCTLLFPAP